ncbi:hypothetical protein [Streptomyces sp. NPDC059071]|uniref:hypothetical protein n=1 Tax=unclassified Streptomyces TaxID=2593676 RepID=UPI0036544F15
MTLLARETLCTTHLVEETGAKQTNLSRGHRGPGRSVRRPGPARAAHHRGEHQAFLPLTHLFPAHTRGGIAGAVLADAMFGEPLVKWSTHDRSAGNLLLGEVVATAGLILLIFGLTRTDRLRFAPVAVASYIGAAYWFTSSTSFANPAVTIGRAFTDTFAGIAPASVPGFVAMQLVGAVAGLCLVAVIFVRGRS